MFSGNIIVARFDESCCDKESPLFIGREKELAELERRYQQPQFQLVVLYGRRRVGKTRLIQQFCQDKPTVFHVGLQQDAHGALASFSRDVLAQLPSEGSEFIESFRSWQEAFHYITLQTAQRRVILVIDEYPYLAQADPAISSILQAVIDHEWKQTNLFCILCGSSMSFMEQQVLGYQSPLYGRRTAQMKIRPLPYWESLKFFPGWPWQERFYAYGVCGGIPQYLEYFAAYDGLDAAIKGELLALSGHLAEEPANLMKQEMRQPALYNAIIGAAAHGASRQSDIASAVKRDAGDITSYLKALLDLEILERQMPMEESNRKKVVYRICDNLYRFWSRFIPASMPLISMGMADAVLNTQIKPHLEEYFGPVFEDICVQYVQRLVSEGRIPTLYSSYGRWWGTDPDTKRQEKIDVVAVTDRDILLGECKWRNELAGVPVLEQLQARGLLIQRNRAAHYAVFSKSGFTRSLLSHAQQGDVMLVSAQEML